MSDRSAAPRQPTSRVPSVVFSASSVTTETAATPVVAAPAPIPVTSPTDVVHPSTPATERAAASPPKHRQARDSRTFPVKVRSMNDPKPGWTVELAVGRLAQGYSVEHVSRLSGYAVTFLRARLRRIDHPRVPSPSIPASSA